MPYEPKTDRRPWTDEEDLTLLSGRKWNLSFSRIAAMLGRTRNSCLGRHHRLMKEMEE